MFNQQTHSHVSDIKINLVCLSIAMCFKHSSLPLRPCRSERAGSERSRRREKKYENNQKLLCLTNVPVSCRMIRLRFINSVLNYAHPSELRQQQTAHHEFRLCSQKRSQPLETSVVLPAKMDIIV